MWKENMVDFFRRFSNEERKKCLLGLGILGISILITFSSGKRCLLLVKYSLQGGEKIDFWKVDGQCGDEEMARSGG